MRAFKNGIRTTLRTPGKTVLFFVILLLLAALVSVAVGVFTAVRAYLKDCDAYFHTVVNVEYLGRDYPDKTTYDDTLVRALEEHRAEMDALCRSEQVISCEPVSNALAQVEGLHRKDRLCYDPDAGVLLVYITGMDEATDAYTAIINEVLYARYDESGKLLCLRIPAMDDPAAPQLEPGGHYLICGHFFQGQSRYLWFQAEEMLCREPERSETVPAFTEWKEKQVPEGNAYARLAAILDRNNDSCPVQYTAALEDRLPFHQQLLTVEEGRMFTTREYAENARVCVISRRLAAVTERSCGDALTLTVRETENDLYGSAPPQSSPETFEIVGIYSRDDDYPFDIYLPVPDTREQLLHPVNGCRLGQFRIKNAGVTEFLAQAQPLEASGFRFTVYDQGYAAAVEPMEELLLISDVFLLICLLLTAAALCLQCHLFISRQRETAQTMLALGSGRAHVQRYFLGGTCLPAVPAVPVGCCLGRLLEQRVLSLLRRLSGFAAAQDLRFSSGRLSLIRTLDFAPRIPAWVYLAAGGLLLLAVVLLTLLFGAGALQDRAKRPRRRRSTPRFPRVRRSSHLRGRLKYALLSILRCTGRTAAVVLFSVVVALFFGQLTDTMHGYRTQLEAVRENTVLTGHATDSVGQKLDGLVVPYKNVEAFLEEELLESSSLSNTIGHLRFLGVTLAADGTPHTVQKPTLPSQGSFAEETLFSKIYEESPWVQSSSVSGSTLFYYTKATELTWLEGFGEQSMQEKEWYCVLPRAMMEANGVALGDSCRFLFATYDYERPVIDTVDLKVVGSYVSATQSDTIFSPIGLVRIKTDRAQLGSVHFWDGSYDSFLFTLKSTDRLPAVRGALADAGFTWVRSGQRLGTCALIDDEVFLNTTHSMERQIKYVGTLHACLYAITGILACALSRLITGSRKKEIALMRALGTQPMRIVANFHAEQTLLCAVGLLAGLGLRALAGRRADLTQLILTAAFFVIWSVTALLCLLRGIRNPAYSDLTEPE